MNMIYSIDVDSYSWFILQFFSNHFGLILTELRKNKKVKPIGRHYCGAFLCAHEFAYKNLIWIPYDRYSDKIADKISELNFSKS